MFKDSGEVIHFVNPKVQASLASNVFTISGHSETKRTLSFLRSACLDN
jgi:nascent polypeptide-associated complex subunit beta